MKITVKLIKLENEFIATCPELDINCYADNRGDAIRRIVSVLKFYIDAATEMGLQVEDLDSISIEGLPSESKIPREYCFPKSDSIN